MPPRPVILIAGPTASGKSALAMRLAAERDGVIINADSMQVYRELRILTARPTADDEATVPHRLYGHVPGNEPYSAGRFVREAADAITAVHAAGQTPIVAGGTGLYFKALLEGLSPIPQIPDAIRAHWRRLEQEQGAYALWTVLMADDPEMALRLDPNDSQRIVRALEVLEATGRSLAEWQRTPGTPVLDAEACERIVVMPEREEIYSRSDARLAAMLDQGAIDEVAALASLNLDAGLPVMRALGVRPLLQFIAGDLGREEALAQGQAETRQYIKRQLTWINGNMQSWNRHNAQ